MKQTLLGLFMVIIICTLTTIYVIDITKNTGQASELTVGNDLPRSKIALIKKDNPFLQSMINVSSNTESGIQIKPGTKKQTKEFTVTATAYTAYCEGCSGITATGINLIKNPNKKVIAVDPTIIPLGTKVYVEGYGEAIAGDIGSAIKGKKIDVFFPEKTTAYNWGVKTVKITILT